MRNVMAKVKHCDKETFAEKLKQIWLQADRKAAVRTAKIFMAEYRQRYPDAIEVLSAGLEDSLQFYSFPNFDRRKISSTNALERINREIRRRSRVVGVFPSEESYVRLITCYLMEYTDDWETERNYMTAEAIQAEKAKIPGAA